MARDQEVVRVLQDINVAIGAIYDLMQRQEDRGRSVSQMGGESTPTSREEQRRQLPGTWPAAPVNAAMQRQSSLWNSLLGMAGGGPISGLLGMMGGSSGGSLFGRGPGGPPPNHPPRGGGGDPNILDKLVKVLEKLDHKLSGFGGGRDGRGEGGGTPPIPLPMTKLGMEAEYQSRKKRAAIDEAKAKFFAAREWEDLGTWGRAKRKLSATASAIGGSISAGHDFMSAAMAGKDVNISAGMSVVGSRMQEIGEKRGGAGGLALAMAGIAMQIPGKLQSISDSAHRMNMGLAEFSPKMASVAAYDEVERILREQRRGQARAESARDLAKARVEAAKDTEGIANDFSKLMSFYGKAWEKTSGWFGRRYDEAQNWMEDKFGSGTKTEELKKMMQPPGVGHEFEPTEELGPGQYMKAIGHAWWWETYGRPPHWEK